MADERTGQPPRTEAAASQEAASDDTASQDTGAGPDAPPHPDRSRDEPPMDGSGPMEFSDDEE